MNDEGRERAVGGRCCFLLQFMKIGLAFRLSHGIMRERREFLAVDFCHNIILMLFWFLLELEGEFFGVTCGNNREKERKTAKSGAKAREISKRFVSLPIESCV